MGKMEQADHHDRELAMEAGGPPVIETLVDGAPLLVTLGAGVLTVGAAGAGAGPQSGSSRWRLRRDGERLALTAADGATTAPGHLLAALEAAFIHYPRQRVLDLPLPPALARYLLDQGLAVADAEQRLQVHADMFWQHGRNWLGTPPALAPFPLQYMISNGRRHPRRPAKPAGTVYARHIPWLDAVLTFRSVDIDQDLDRFHRWMNDPVVAHFWQEQGDLARQRAYLEGIAADPHVIPLIACLDGQPFGYFEVYWAREDRIAPFCEAADHDRGWHVLIGEPAYRGKAFVSAWMPSISHYLFLDDARTQRLVIEPRADNGKMMRSLDKCGYALLKEFDFPHKRAMLGMLLRERFFSERLWQPRPDAAT